ncbi:MAG: hypothetical protein KBE41_05125 [Lutibacter sp.]|nr:hypothetical protein [Lutibacter sp.]MBP9600866.1 hypothetical protein [Lutibacter sp.]
MKRFLIIVLVFLGSFTLVNANTVIKSKVLVLNYTSSIEPVIFEENGMQFTIIIDENARFIKLKIKHLFNTDKTKPIGIQLKTDTKGRLAFANSTPIIYSSNGKVAKIGPVLFSYRGSKIRKVGNLEVIQNENGEISYKGHVKGATMKYFTKKPKIRMS